MAGEKPWTALDAINVGKGTTLLLLWALAARYGLQQPRHLLYFGFHSSYLIYWFLHQYLVADTYKPFNEPCPRGFLAFAVVVIGFGFTYPAYLTFQNDMPISTTAAVLSFYLWSTGSAINIAADFYKAGAKASGAGLVMSGPYRLAIRLNYFGDLARYSAFALCSGRLPSFGLPAFVALINMVSIRQQLKDQHKRYGADFQQYISKTPLLVPYTWPLSPAGNSAAAKRALEKSR